MTHGPWWVERVSALLEPVQLDALPLGALFRLCDGLHFVRDNVDAALLPLDFARAPETRATWEQFEQREGEAQRALQSSRARVSSSVCDGRLGPTAFRATWQQLGYATNASDAGTPADDWLDGLFAEAGRGEVPPPLLGNLNLSSRARRAADFLTVVEPGRGDVVFDLGSGTGKFALTVSASTFTRVVGVECCAEYVQSSRRSAEALALTNARFEQADARDVDLSAGSVFYLYHPFRDAVAQAVAEGLGELARAKDICVFSAGPAHGYGEFFTREVEKGALRLDERRGEFDEVMLLRSAR